MENFVKHVHYNRCFLCGQVAQAPQPSHMNHGRAFDRLMLSVPRLSGQEDLLPVLLPREVTETLACREGETIQVAGQLRSFNNRTGQGARLIISVLGHAAERSEAPPANTVHLSGTICKEPTFRRTPLGREICDIILAVNRRYGRGDYLPCIAWGAVAEQTALLGVGAPLALEGRLQSRTYTKQLPQGSEERTAYEVSVMQPLEAEQLT